MKDELLNVALAAKVGEGEDVYWSIVFGLKNDSEEVRRIMAREIVRTAIAAALDATPRGLGIRYKPETWPEDADGDKPRLCTVCGTPVHYGERHHGCGSAVMKAETAAVAAALAASHPQEAALAQPQAVAPYAKGGPGWKQGQVIDQFVDDYVMEQESGCYAPSEHERMLLADFAHGLTSDDDFIEASRALYAAAPAQPAQEGRDE